MNFNPFNKKDKPIHPGDYITEDEAKKVGNKIHVNWKEISIDEFTMGMNDEKEHFDVTMGDRIKIGRIALAHLREDPEYYTKVSRALLKR